ncbi:MAG: ComEC/Rec2 family competence protein, partial [Rubrimonas sp.]
YGLAALHARAAAAPVLAAPHAGLVQGRVIEISQSAAGRPRLLLAVPRIEGLAAEDTPARVRITLGSARYGQGLRPGDWVALPARLTPPGGPVEPGGFDFARAAWFERLGAVGLGRGPVERIEGPPPEAWAERAALARDRLRMDVSDWLRAGVGGEAGAFAAAIATGDRAGLPPDAVAALRDSGLAHLLAISGLHMAIVCGLVFGVVRLAAAPFPGLRGKALAAAAALAVGAAYLALSGGSVATQRAFVMAGVAFAAMLLDRPAVTMRALAAAAIVVLAVAPESVLAVGFQMSFAATLALVAAYEAARDRGWLRRGKGWRRWAMLWLGGLVATSAIAGLATAPYAAAAFNRATPWALVANLAAVPAMGTVVAPAMAAAGVLAPLGLERPALAVAGAGIDWILGVARWTAALPGATAPVPAPPDWAMAAITLGGLWLCLWRGRLRLGGLAGLALGLGLWAAAPSRPALLVSVDPASGWAAGVMTDQGRAVAGSPAARFAPETWLRRDGDAALYAQAAARAGWTPEGTERMPELWLTAVTPGGAVVQIYAGRTLRDTSGARGVWAARCARGGVLIAPFAPAPSVAPGPCVALDGAAMAAMGAVAVRDGRDGVVVIPASAPGRPWRRGVGGGGE